MAFSLEQAFLSFLQQRDHQASRWSGTYIILINSLKFKEKRLCNCMELNRKPLWTPHISLPSVFASYEQLAHKPAPFAGQFCALSRSEAFFPPTFLSLAACGLCLPCFFPFMNVTGESWVQTEEGIATGGASRRKRLGCWICEHQLTWFSLCPSAGSFSSVQHVFITCFTEAACVCLWSICVAAVNVQAPCGERNVELGSGSCGQLM